MQHVGRDGRDAPRYPADRGKVAGAELAGDGGPLDAQGEKRREFGQCCLGARAAGQAVDDQADAVATGGLAAGDVEHVTKQAADRRAKDVKDFQAFRRNIGVHRRGCRAPKRVCVLLRYQTRGCYRPLIQNLGRKIGHDGDP
jgi:hypothetical protein